MLMVRKYVLLVFGCRKAEATGLMATVLAHLMTKRNNWTECIESGLHLYIPQRSCVLTREETVSRLKLIIKHSEGSLPSRTLSAN